MPEPRRVLLLGAGHQVAVALQAALVAAGHEILVPETSVDSGERVGARGPEPGRSDPWQLAGSAAAVGRLRPDVVLLAPDWPAVEAPTPPVELARLARAGRAADARLVLVSGEEVFGGTSGPVSEGDRATPTTELGRWQLAAETALRVADPAALVIRSAQLFGWHRRSPNVAMEVWRNLASSRRVELSRVRTGTPLLLEDLAVASRALIELEATGTVHVAGADVVSDHDLAVAVAEVLDLDPDLVTDDPAAVPWAGGLRSDRLAALTGLTPPALNSGVRRFRRRLRAANRTTFAHPAASDEAATLRAEILQKVADYHRLAHAPQPFVPEQTRVNYSGRVYGPEELVAGTEAVLDFWLTLGPRGDAFERAMRRRLGVADVVLVNSGSAANLTAIMSLMSANRPDPIRPGDEVITPAVTFPTTLTPLVHGGLVPVFVDVELGTYNIEAARVEAALSERTRAIVVPHTLGNPCELDVLVDIARRHDLILVEDMCDALGATYDGRPVGTFGQLATMSFYPAHHITMGEGGTVVVNRGGLARTVRSVRDWGRDCWCAPGESDTCGQRFGWQLGDLPAGYDHKYVYSTFGYNFKPTDIQAAIGLAQLERLDGFLSARQANFDTLYRGLEPWSDLLLLPRSLPRAGPAWFGFPITVRGGLRRADMVRWLEAANIETRQVFAGNILRQPAFQGIERRVHGELVNSDRVMRDTFFLGVYPGLTAEMLQFVLDRVEAFFRTRPAGRLARTQ